MNTPLAEALAIHHALCRVSRHIRLLLAVLLLCCFCPGSAHSMNTSAQYTNYLPLVTNPYTGLQLYGYVTENGRPVAGLQVRLIFGITLGCQDGTLVATTTTDNTGLYNFENIATLSGPIKYIYPCYQVIWENNERTPARLAKWSTKLITSYEIGTTVKAGDFDIADIQRIEPQDGAVFPQNINAQAIPLYFTWKPRTNVNNDTYAVSIKNDNDTADYTTPALGRIGEYGQVFGLCFDGCFYIQLRKTYKWKMRVYQATGTPHEFTGYGETFERTFQVPIKQ